MATEIKELKAATDQTITEATEFLSAIEKKQKSRKSGQPYFETVMPQLTHCCPSANLSCSSLMRLGADHSALPRMAEPMTAMTKATGATGITFATSSSKVSHGRHKSQGPMRSEKVYHMTRIINQKCI